MIKDSFGKYVDIYEKVEFDSKKSFDVVGEL